LKKYCEGSIEAFFKKRTGGRCINVLTPEKLEQAQKLLDAGLTRYQIISEQLKIGKNHHPTW
jgi:hypothetical protein